MRDAAALIAAAAREAGALALSYFGRTIDVWDKGRDNPVSEADLSVDQLLKERLLGACPGDGWLSEETADDPARLDRRRVWVVDPIDGTRDFIRGRDGWAVSIALVEDGQPVLAALCAPARGQLYLARAGGGATRDGQRLAVSTCNSVTGCRLPADLSTITARYWPEPWEGATAVEKPNGLALRIAKIAAQEADAFFEGRPMGEWDIAAAALILTEAGGTITDRDGRPLVFNKPQPRLRGTIAAVPAIHGEVKRRVGLGITALNTLRRNGEFRPAARPRRG